LGVGKIVDSQDSVVSPFATVDKGVDIGNGLSLNAQGTTQAYRPAEREPPEVAAKWISPDINAGKWEGYTPPPLPKP
jgi:hypothetical protein